VGVDRHWENPEGFSVVKHDLLDKSESEFDWLNIFLAYSSSIATSCFALGWLSKNQKNFFFTK
jgi:hypothetical protein